MSDPIRWPPGCTPAEAPVFARNALRMAVSPASAWECLTDASRWPSWYRNSWRVRVIDATRLGPGVAFTWWTFGLRIRSRVVDWDPPSYLGWAWWCRGAHGYHGWSVSPRADGGVDIVTAETQLGVLPSLTRLIMRPTLHAAHQYWLARLTVRARE